MPSIKNLFGFRKNKGLDKSIIQKNPYRNNIDLNKRQFMKKGLLGLAGLGGLALASKVAKAGGLVFNDATNQETAAGGWVELQSVTASSDATVDLENGIGSDYDEYMIKMSGVTPSSDGANLNLRLKVGGSYRSDAYYEFTLDETDASDASQVLTTTQLATAIRIAEGPGNASGESLHQTLYFGSPDGTSFYKTIYADGAQYRSLGDLALCRVNGGYTTLTTALTGVRIMFSSGNISGQFTLYGLTKK